MDSSLKRETAKATLWSTITEIIARCILPIVNMILARLLAPEAFGVIATITMIVSFAEIFTDAGFQKYLIQHDFVNEQDLDQNTNVAFWTNLVISILIWFIIITYAEPLSVFVGNPGLGKVIVVASLSIPIYAFSSIQMARYKRNMEFRNLFYIRLISILTPFLVTIPLAFYTHSYWSLVIGTLAGNAVNAIILTLYSNWRPSLFYSLKKLKDMLSYSWWILLESISTWMTSYADTFIVGSYLSLYYLGLYKTSMITVNQIMSLITASTSAPLFVALSRLKNDKAQLEGTYIGYIQAISFFVIPLSVGIWLYRDLITMILLGEQWMEAANFIGFWGLLSSLALVFGTYANGLYNAIGRTSLSFIVGIINLFFLLPTIWITASCSFEMLYISRSLLRILFVFIQCIIMALVIKFPIHSLLKCTIPPFICTLPMILISMLCFYISDNTIWIFLSTILCTIIYFSISYLFYKKEMYNAFLTLGFDFSKLNKWNRNR